MVTVAVDFLLERQDFPGANLYTDLAALAALSVNDYVVHSHSPFLHYSPPAASFLQFLENITSSSPCLFSAFDPHPLFCLHKKIPNE
jgi:hypothetical protein